MTGLLKRRLLTGIWALTAGTLCMGSVAFACLQFEGVGTFDGNHANDVPRTVVATNVFMSVCSDTGGPATVVKGAASVAITVRAKGVNDCGDGVNDKLPAGMYDILTSSGGTADACRNPNDPSGGTSTGETMTVDASGAGSTTATWNANPAGQHHVCVSMQNVVLNGYHGIATFVTSSI